MLNKYKAIIFDFDDTLTRSRGIKFRQIQETGRKFYNFNITESTINKYWGMPFQELISNVFNKADNTDDLIKNYLSLSSEFPMQLHDGVFEAINKLKDSHLLGIVTASGGEAVRSDLIAMNLPLETFFHLQTAEDTEFHKPDPRVFEPLLEKLSELKISIKEALYVGDSLTDLAAAKAAGIDFIGVTTGIITKKEFTQAGAKSIDNLMELTQKKSDTQTLL